MEALHGFYSEQICKLRKSLYGLKQAPYLWYQALSTILKALRYLYLHADHYTFTNKTYDVFILVFINDLQITGLNTLVIDTLRASLKTKFTLKELST
jgi:hypothetical protein